MFDPNDRFTVKFASSINISGVDFFEDFQFEDLDHSFWGGTKAVEGQRQLIITPTSAVNIITSKHRSHLQETLGVHHFYLEGF